MSYSIFYRAMHVKTSRGILPMVEIGDNNVYEFCSGRRARSWYNLHVDNKVLFKDWEAINAAIETWNESYHKQQEEHRNSDKDWKRETAENNFGYFQSLAVYGKSTWKTTFNDVRNLIKSGIKYMLTIDEAIEKKRLYITGDWDGGKQKPNILIENEDMLFEALDKGKWIIFSRVDDLYDEKKALALMAKPRGKNAYKVHIKDTDGKVHYISMNDERNQFVLVDTEDEAMAFTYKGVNKWWLFRRFFDFTEMGYRYIS